jgi:diguanylate cyclase (GGDEF)-like protein
MLPTHVAHGLTWSSLATLAVVLALVRSGVSQRLADPVITLPHATVAIGLCFLAYIETGEHRASVLILVAEAIVMAMFRLRPQQMLVLGLTAVGMLCSSIAWLVWRDPVAYPASTGTMHLSVGGAALLTLTLVAKWVTAIRIRISVQAQELSHALATLQHMATQDGLTGLLNRRVMTELAESELKLSDRAGHPLTAVLIDLDHFKQVNDRHGHQAGDAVLAGFAGLAKAQLRQVDKLARWGGEEFLVLMPMVGAHEAIVAIERLRQSAGSLRFPGFGSLQVSFSAGLAQAHAGETLEHLIERADRALYQAKTGGRNRCQVAPTSAPAWMGDQPSEVSL